MEPGHRSRALFKARLKKSSAREKSVASAVYAAGPEGRGINSRSKRTLAELFGRAAFEHAMMLRLLTDKKNENFFSGIFLKKKKFHLKKRKIL
jgi:hypothetical protein